MEHAFRGPWKIRERLGSIDPAMIAGADPDDFVALATTPPAIHRYGRAMALRIQELARLIVDEYEGDASQIWETAESGPELLRRVRSLPGFGDQKSRIFVALLAKRVGARPPGWETAAGDYALPGYRSVADVYDAQSLQQVRAYKKAAKAAAKAT